jgi:hypothetical protein
VIPAQKFRIPVRVAFLIWALALTAAAAAAVLSPMAAMTTTAARNEAVKRWGPTGAIRQEQTGTSTAWTYSVGLMTPYGFEVRGSATGSYDRAFAVLTLPPVVPAYRAPLAEPIVIAYGRVQLGRDPDVVPLPTSKDNIVDNPRDDVLTRASENGKHRDDADVRLAQFLDAVCSVAAKACDTAGKEFRVALVQ